MGNSFDPPIVKETQDELLNKTVITKRSPLFRDIIGSYYIKGNLFLFICLDLSSLDCYMQIFDMKTFRLLAHKKLVKPNIPSITNGRGSSQIYVSKKELIYETSDCRIAVYSIYKRASPKFIDFKNLKCWRYAPLSDSRLLILEHHTTKQLVIYNIWKGNQSIMPIAKDLEIEDIKAYSKKYAFIVSKHSVLCYDVVSRKCKFKIKGLSDFQIRQSFMIHKKELRVVTLSKSDDRMQYHISSVNLSVPQRNQESYFFPEDTVCEPNVQWLGNNKVLVHLKMQDAELVEVYRTAILDLTSGTLTKNFIKDFGGCCYVAGRGLVVFRNNELEIIRFFS